MTFVSIFAQEKTQPNPGETNKSRAGSDKIKNKSQSDKTPAAQSPAVKNPDAAPTPQQQSRNVAPENKEQTVRVSAIPRISIESVKDWTDRATWIFTGLLVVVGFLQFVILVRQTRIINDSLVETRNATALTRESLVLSHRPQLIVRNVVVREPATMRVVAFGNDTIASITGQFYVANIGGTRARITEVYSLIGSGALPMERPYETHSGIPVDIPLLPGQSTPITLPTNIGTVFVGKPSVLATPAGGEAYVMGWVAYTDDMGNLRRTAFCRQWNLLTEKFSIMTDADYEHAE